MFFSTCAEEWIVGSFNMGHRYCLYLYGIRQWLLSVYRQMSIRPVNDHMEDLGKD